MRFDLLGCISKLAFLKISYAIWIYNTLFIGSLKGWKDQVQDNLDQPKLINIIE